jgi:hypothetical protein
MAVPLDSTGARRRQQQDDLRRRARRQRLMVGGATAAVVVGVFVVFGGLPGGKKRSGEAVAEGSASGAGAYRAAAPAKPRSDARNVNLSFVGDMIFGNTPQLPAKPYRYLDAVKSPLTRGVDVVFANHEGAITNAGGGKCGSGSENCFAFRVPKRFARVYKQIGFDVLNLANNHSYDFGAAGQRDSARAIRRVGMKHTGLAGDIAVVKAGGTAVAYVGFAPYRNMQSLLDTGAAQRLVRSAHAKAPIVVAYMHAGGEGRDQTHVPRGSENYLGENRGNSRKFARAMIDAGASAVVGSGPHVLRGIEFHRGHPIVYSLGNFAGYHNFSTSDDRRRRGDRPAHARARRQVPLRPDRAHPRKRRGASVARRHGNQTDAVAVAVRFRKACPRDQGQRKVRTAQVGRRRVSAVVQSPAWPTKSLKPTTCVQS